MYREMSALLVIFSFLISAVFFESAPDEFAIHWNKEGVANSFLPKGAGLFFLPTLSAVLYLALSAILRYRGKTGDFEYLAIFNGYMAALSFGMIAFNFGYKFNMIFLVAITLSALLFAIGVSLEKRKKTKFDGKLFKVLSPFILVTIFIPELFQHILVAICAIFVVHCFRECRGFQPKNLA